MTRFILILLSISICSQVYSQIDGVTEQLMARKFLNDLYAGKVNYDLKSQLPENLPDNFQPYLFKEARPTVIYTLQGDTVSGLFKYNVVTETLEPNSGGDSFVWNSVVSFQFQAYNGEEAISFTNQKLFDPNGIGGGFLEDVSASSDVKRKYFLLFVPGKEPTQPYSDASSEDKIVLQSEILIRLSENEIVEMPDSRKDFYELFPEKSEELKKFAKKNKLKTNNPADIGKMVAWVKSGQ